MGIYGLIIRLAMLLPLNKQNANEKVLKDQLIAAQAAAYQAKRAVRAAWFSGIVNVLVVAAAVLLQFYQRAITKYDAAIASKNMDKVLLLTGYTRLSEASELLDKGGLLDPKQCSRNYTISDIEKLRGKLVENSMASLNQFTFQQILNTSVQNNQQSMVIRTTFAIESALKTIEEIQTDKYSFEDKKLICQDVIRDVLVQSNLLKQQIIDDYANFVRPLRTPILYDDEYYISPFTIDDGIDFDAAVEKIVLPSIDAVPALAREAK